MYSWLRDLLHDPGRDGKCYVITPVSGRSFPRNLCYRIQFNRSFDAFSGKFKWGILVPEVDRALGKPVYHTVQYYMSHAP
jgi:hypothetical protein